MKINNAIIIHGPGRSGTTLLSNLLSLYSGFYWISGYNNKFPAFPSLSIFNNLLKYQSFEKYTRNKKKFPRPAEAYDFWNYYIPNFNDSNLTISNIDYEKVNKCRETITKIGNRMNGKRFITKITGYSRFTILNELFSNPSIIWIERDPRIVVMSYYKQKWFYKKNEEIFNKTSNRELLEIYVEKYLSFYKDKKKLTKFNFTQILYEDLIQDRKKVFCNIFSQIGEKINPKFQKTMDSWEVRQNLNNNYNNFLDKDELDFLNQSLKKPIIEMGYTFNKS
ncbi:MAG: sulfotransferase [Candidatus Marinimicrobia bacterium]|nr:sulfotransferase [Candidatus Neomarinimicrobiota bacterium]